MQKRRLAVLFLAVSIAIVLPSIAFAASGSAGLVPCGVSSDPNLATQCQACNLIQLAQNVITFMIGIAVPIAMAMFAYAGFLYFTSGVGGTENISKARKIFSSSAIGFALALTSWLIVNTVLFTVLNHDQYPNSSWFHIDCTTRPTPTNIGDVIASHLGIAPTVDISKQTVQPTCASGSPSADGKTCINDTGQIIGTPTAQNTISSAGVGNCSPTSLQNAWGSNAVTMSCIAQQESSCGAQPYSTVDLTPAGQAVSVGLYQINLSANKVLCGSQTLDCPSAFSGTYTGKNKNVSITNQSLYNDCVNAALSNSCSTQTALSIYSNQGIKAWGTAGLCGY